MYTGDEIKYAVQDQNYQILSVSGVFYYPRYRMDLFHDILEYFGRVKLTSKGFPREDMSSDEKEQYVQHLRETTGFKDLKVSEFVYSPARVTIAKLIINSLIGIIPLTKYSLKCINSTLWTF